jgi:hypothetical protein
MGLQLNLYTLPSNVYDWLGSEGVDLRLDDHSQATGQQIQAIADAAVGATTLSVAALTYPLLRGSTLQFDGSGMPAQSPAVLTAVANVGATQLTVAPLAAGINALSAAVDSGVNVATAQRLLTGCQYGTTQVKLYCCKRYDDSQLLLNAQENGSVGRWATCLAARWICRRRTQACPKGLEADSQEALEEMRGVMSGALSIEDIGTRTSGWPYMSVITVDVRYEVARVRVMPLLSEGTPTNYAQQVDYNSLYYAGYL